MTMNVIPGKTPCFRCLHPRAAGGAMLLTCDTAGVIGPAPLIVGSLQSTEAMKLLVGAENLNQDLITIDAWEGTLSRYKVRALDNCPACNGQFEFLEAKFGTRTTSLCGQNAVQVINPKAEDVSLSALAAQLKPAGEVSYNEFMLRFQAGDHEMVVFPDGRAIVKNTNDESVARGLYAKYIGM
jgi:adenylyltransferase/sulfurtransferase